MKKELWLKKNSTPFLIALCIVGLSMWWWQAKGRPMLETTRALASMAQIKRIGSAVGEFKTKHNAFPGIITATDGSTKISNVLFWKHLTEGGYVEQKDYKPLHSINGKFIVAHIDNKIFPAGTRPENAEFKGFALLITSSPNSDDPDEIRFDEFPITPKYAKRLDSGKFDDGRPDKGFIQAYGPRCFTKENGEYVYNTKLDEKVCGMIFNFPK